MKCAVVVFSGTNCDIDTFRACEYLKMEVSYVFHNETSLDDYDLVILPGGFSYGDCVSSGNLAKFSPVLTAVSEYIEKKRGFVLGICNGFQILCECGLLPGTLAENEKGKFICDDVELTLYEHGVERSIMLPIAHSEGRYVVDEDALNELDEKNMIFLKYKKNQNGSVYNIAGVYDKENHVLGMMPHPERAVFKELGCTDGRLIFSIIKSELSDLLA